MRRQIFAVACLALSLAGCATQPTSMRLEQVEWGSTQAEIRARQAREPIVESGDRSVYHGRFAGLPVTLVYHFDAGGLDEIVLINRAQHDRRNRYIEDYEQVRERLRERHGEPRFETMQWHNRLFANEPERFGDAVSAGHLTYLARWNAEGARILMGLRGERYQVIHEIIFRPPESDS